MRTHYNVSGVTWRRTDGGGSKSQLALSLRAEKTGLAITLTRVSVGDVAWGGGSVTTQQHGTMTFWSSDSLSLFLTLLWALCFREKLVCLVRFIAIHPQYLKYQTSDHRTNLLVTVCHSIKLQYILLTFPVPSAIHRRWLINEWSLGNASNLIPSKAPQQHNYQKRPHRLSHLMERNEPKPRRCPYISHNSIPILSSKFVENS